VTLIIHGLIFLQLGTLTVYHFYTKSSNRYRICFVEVLHNVVNHQLSSCTFHFGWNFQAA